MPVESEDELENEGLFYIEGLFYSSIHAHGQERQGWFNLLNLL